MATNPSGPKIARADLADVLLWARLAKEAIDEARAAMAGFRRLPPASRDWVRSAAADLAEALRPLLEAGPVAATSCLPTPWPLLLDRLHRAALALAETPGRLQLHSDVLDAVAAAALAELPPEPPAVKGKEIDRHMREVLDRQPECVEWTSREWAARLGCSKTAVQEAEAWQLVLRKRAEARAVRLSALRGR